MRSNRHARQAVSAHILALTIALASCGGGGDGGGSSCSGGQNVYTNFEYPTAFDLYHVNQDATVAPLKPSAPDVPAACESSKRFSISSGSMPPGLKLDANTGVISGTLTVPGHYFFVIKLELVGLSGFVDWGITSNVAAPQAYTRQAWSVPSNHLPFGSGRLDALGNTLVVTAPTGINPDQIVTAFTSSDGGLNWNESSAGSGPLSLSGFATTSNGSAVFVSGGRTYTGDWQNNVHKFDGTAWSVVTPNAEFSARQNHALVWKDAKLYAIGGDNANGVLTDVWQSEDGGMHWRQATSSIAAAPARIICAFALGNQLSVLTSTPSTIFGGSALIQVWRSTDGATWTPTSIPTTSSFRALSPPNPQCLVSAGRAYVFGPQEIVSSTDLVNWNFEPAPVPFLSSPFGGGAVIDGDLYVLDGVATSQRTLYRSAPVSAP